MNRHLICVGITLAFSAAFYAQDQAKIGLQADGRIIVPR
jgi:hypothetical protein